jgi:hypothetical protein
MIRVPREMAESLFNIVLARTKEVVSKTHYFSITCDDVTTLDNQYWISIHVYTIQDWEIVPMFLYLQRVTEGGGADNIKKMTLGALTNEGGLTKHQIRDRFMAFDTYGASILQGKRNGVTTSYNFLMRHTCKKCIV